MFNFLQIVITILKNIFTFHFLFLSLINTYINIICTHTCKVLEKERNRNSRLPVKIERSKTKSNIWSRLMEKAYTDRVQAPTKWRESLNSRLLSYRSHIRPFSSLSLLFCANSLRSANPRGVLTARKRFPRFSTLGLTSHPVAGKHPSENATACWYLVESISLPTHLNCSNSGWIWYVLFIYLFYSTTLCFSLDSRRGL